MNSTYAGKFWPYAAGVRCLELRKFSWPARTPASGSSTPPALSRRRLSAFFFFTLLCARAGHERRHLEPAYDHAQQPAYDHFCYKKKKKRKINEMNLILVILYQ